jgi:hypothetical protein
MNKCPVCGYNGLDTPSYDGFGNPSYDICDCCGTQFGYHDHSTSFAVLRDRWIAKGMPWHSRAVAPPPGWDPVQQLRSLTNDPGGPTAPGSGRNDAGVQQT